MAAKKKASTKSKKVSKTNDLQTFGVPELEKLLENANKAEALTFELFESLKPLIKHSFSRTDIKIKKVSGGDSPLEDILNNTYERLNSFSEMLSRLSDNLTLKSDTSDVKCSTASSNTPAAPYISDEYASLVVACNRFNAVFYELIEMVKPYVSSVEYANDDEEQDETTSSFAVLISHCNNALHNVVNSKYKFIFST